MAREGIEEADDRGDDDEQEEPDRQVVDGAAQHGRTVRETTFGSREVRAMSSGHVGGDAAGGHGLLQRAKVVLVLIRVRLGEPR